MILIYICNNDKVPQKHIENCKINPSAGVINYRTDLEFYVLPTPPRSPRYATTLSSTAVWSTTICARPSRT